MVIFTLLGKPYYFRKIMETITIKRMHDERIKSGHLWVFSNELVDVPKTIPPGSIVRVKNSRGDDFGQAFFNANSLIAARILQWKDSSPISVNFFVERFQLALQRRKKLLGNEECFRLAFGESDLLPGLVVDIYGEYASVQTLSFGMDVLLNDIIYALKTVFPNLKGIVEKNKSSLRDLEGLQPREGVIWGEVPDEILVKENDFIYSVQLIDGQKTGLFLDQKLNRRAVEQLSEGLRVLDCFTNQGGFAMHASRGGAKYTLGVDSSKKAIERCNENAKVNNCNNIEFRVEEVFAFLDKQLETNQKWDMIILDPPSFTKSKKNVPEARRGYERINRVALCLVESGGYLVTASCSHHIFEDVFLEIITQSAEKEGRQLQLVHRGMQSPDHPILLSMPQTKYLKFYIFQVL